MLLKGGDATPGRLTWADVPALLLAGVSAITVTAGARLLRGQDRSLMLVLGIGVAGATVVLEKLMVERLNAVRPRQSFVALLLCWCPLFLFSTSLATFATFSWLAPQIARRDLEQSGRIHWTHEVEKVSRYVATLKSALHQQASITQSDIAAERQHAAAARAEGAPFSGDGLRTLQRRAVTIRDLDRRVATFQSLPLEVPSGPDAGAQLDHAFRDLEELQAAAAVTLAAPPAVPIYEPYAPPPADLQSILAEETQRRSWSAITAWAAAFWVELLPLLALWRGGRKIPLATRVRQWRGQIVGTVDAVRGGQPATAIPIVIEPLQVRGIVRITSAPEYTLTDCTPLLEQAVEALTSVLGAYQLKSVSNARGGIVNDDVPLLPQLQGEPLVLSVVEDPS